MNMNAKWSLTSLVFIFCGSLFFPISAQAEETQKSDQSVKVYRAYVPVLFHDGGFYPVVGVEKKKPLISVEGQLVSVKKDAKAFFWANQSDVLPTVRTGSHVSTIDTGVGHGLTGASFPAGGRPSLPIPFPLTSLENETRIVDNDQSSFWEQVEKTNGPLVDAYGVFIFYSDEGVAELHWRNLKNTSEGKNLSVKVPYLSRKTLKLHKNLRYLLLSYQAGAELVPSDHPQRGELLNWFETLSMAQIAGSYANAIKKEEVDPVFIFRPNFDLNKTDRKILEGKVVSVSMIVNKMGVISEVSLEADIPDSIARKILDTVRLWKFFPAIREGKLADEEVILPLQF
jgi:hypothetical protein